MRNIKMNTISKDNKLSSRCNRKRALKLDAFKNN